MGNCMKDHPAQDVLEKLSEVHDQLNLSLAIHLKTGLEQVKWDQNDLNELFHALKKLEKNISADEKEEIRKQISKLIDS